MKTKAKVIIEELLKLQIRYSYTKRANVPLERYLSFYNTNPNISLKEYLISKTLLEKSRNKNNKFDFMAEYNREPLIEHVGHLPIVASFIYPHLEHMQDVDLGKVLIMLSIHDIGETETGDIVTYNKKVSQYKTEYDIAINILDSYYLSYYKELVSSETLSAKFAKSIDVLVPMLHSLSLPPKAMIESYKIYGLSTKDVIRKKKENFEWDKILKNIFEIIIEEYWRREKGIEAPVINVKYD